MPILHKKHNETEKQYIDRLNSENHKVNVHNAKIYRDDPNYILIGDVEKGWEALHVNGKRGKAWIKKHEDRKKIAEQRVQDREDAVEIVTEILEDEETDSKIRIRQELNKLGAFSVENLEAVYNNLV